MAQNDKIEKREKKYALGRVGGGKPGVVGAASEHPQ